jgi:hypothetical protein
MIDSVKKRGEEPGDISSFNLNAESHQGQMTGMGALLPNDGVTDVCFSEI